MSNPQAPAAARKRAPNAEQFLNPVKTKDRAAALLSSSEFERFVERERELADRHLHGFAVIVLVPRGGKPEELDAVANMMLERARFCDFVGRLDGSRLGALLPCTSGREAWVLADELLGRIARAGMRFDCKVFSYQTGEPAPKVAHAKPGTQDDDRGDSGPGDSGTIDELRVATDLAAPLQFAVEIAQIRDAAGDRPVEDLTPELCLPISFRKRFLDIVVASGALIVLAPALACVAALIKLTSPGPVIFKQKRAGVGGRPFDFYKFRSMYVDAEARKSALKNDNEADGPVFKMKNDPRITPIGRFLRKWSVDELPQLWNVLKGDMTLVGPRPPLLEEVAAYEPWQRRRLALHGGLTCIWQVSGRSSVGFEDWMRMDAQYAKKRGLWMDLRILWQTAGAVLARRGAY